ncbi:MAG: GTPase HflX [Candidatus Dependentiae bacterium]|nr:GTPase HflX [Candidatus Dependentiae bacterium]
MAKSFYIPGSEHDHRILIVGVQTPMNRMIDAQAYFQEFRNLVSSSGVVPTAEFMTKLRAIDNGYFFTKGKLEEIKALCNQHRIDEVIVSERLDNQQERNLTAFLGGTIIDRTELILDIFEKGATSAEGKLQVEVALLQHKKSRVSGRGVEMSQQAGSIGTRGPGETQKEKELQHLERQASQLRKQLAQLERVRETQRKRRTESRMPHIAIIGYTNAGKSTILNALTKSTVFAENRLFATLDTTTRELFIGGKKWGTISDTVGFIQNLPHELIEAFKSTLSELKYASLLLEVIDLSDKNWRNHIRVVQSILEELEIFDTPILYVFNKSDLLDEKARAEVTPLLEPFQPQVLVSATSKEGLKPLVVALENWNHKKAE